MSVKREEGGRRSVHLEFEVPGTPEQVWQAIATGPGITTWLFPTEVEERVGGAVAFRMGPGLASSGTVTAWEPPRRFAYEEADWAENAPPLGTEFVIEARSGGTCVVRLVHSLFAAGGDWDDELESFETGWMSHFGVLRLVLAHFFGQDCATFRVMGHPSGSEAEAWEALAGALGLAGAAKGERLEIPGAIRLAGVVERTGQGKLAHELLLRLDEPASGVAVLGAYTWGESAHTVVSLYLFGERARAVAAREEPLWSARFQQLFPAATASGQAA